MRRRRLVDDERVVIVGAGRAGLAAAEELHRLEFSGEIIVLGDEPEGPYDRPACSKGLLTGRHRPSDVMLSLEGCGEVDWRFGRRAVSVDLAAREVWTDTDERFPYDGLIVATGSHAVAPVGWPNGAPGLHVLHRLSDAWTLRHDLRDADRVAVVGGGLTGCETAAAVRALARRCVLIDANPQVMTRAIGEYVGGLVTEELRREGVDLRLGRRVKEIDRSRRNWRLVLDDGSLVDADVVVMTTGERPDTGWLESAGSLDLSDGVLCDESLRVVGASGVVAAGAVARWPNPRSGGRPIRCGQWLSALEQGKAAASTLMAGDGRVPPVTLLPRFWSEQFGLRIQAAGELPADAEMQVSPLGRGRGRHREVARSGVLVSYSRDDHLVGLVAVNAPRPFNAVTRSMLVSPEPMSWAEEAPVRRYLSAVN